MAFSSYIRSVAPPTLRSLQAPDIGKGISGMFTAAQELGDNLAKQDVLEQLNAYKNANTDATERDMLNLVQSLGVRENIANNAQNAIANMFKLTGAETTAAADASKQKELFREHYLDKDLEELKSKHALEKQDKYLQGLLARERIKNKGKNKSSKDKFTGFTPEFMENSTDTDYWTWGEFGSPEEANIMFRKTLGGEDVSDEMLQKLYEDYIAYTYDDQWGTPTHDLDSFKKYANRLNKNK